MYSATANLARARVGSAGPVVLSVFGIRDRWLAVYFTTLGAGNPDDQIAALLTNLSDAMMTTFRWEQELRGEPV